jgi:hypothetical protein
LNRVVKEVEKTAVRLGLPGNEVAFGVTPSFEPIATQMPVMLTGASVIGLSIPFFVFCAAVTKAMALTLVHFEVGDQIAVDNRPAAVRQKLKFSPELVKFWFRIFRDFGAGTWPADLQQPAISSKGESATRVLLLRAVELFVVAHEYAHHALGHGRVDSTDHEAENSISQEHDADVVAQTICAVAQQDEIAPNVYAKSGAGAVVILGALDLVRRTNAVLETGEDVCEPRNRHPPFRERIGRIAGVDQFAPVAERGSLAELRGCFCEILEIIWAEVRPLLAALHRDGVRPADRKTDVGGWLPLSPRIVVVHAAPSTGAMPGDCSDLPDT